jgi:hypothetical protein
LPTQDRRQQHADHRAGLTADVRIERGRALRQGNEEIGQEAPDGFRQDRPVKRPDVGHQRLDQVAGHGCGDHVDVVGSALLRQAVVEDEDLARLHPAFVAWRTGAHLAGQQEMERDMVEGVPPDARGIPTVLEAVQAALEQDHPLEAIGLYLGMEDVPHARYVRAGRVQVVIRSKAKPRIEPPGGKGDRRKRHGRGPRGARCGECGQARERATRKIDANQASNVTLVNWFLGPATTHGPVMMRSEVGRRPVSGRCAGPVPVPSTRQHE